MSNFDPSYSQENQNYSDDLEPYIGMPIGAMAEVKTQQATACDGVDSCPLAMAYVPWQRWNQTYEPDLAFTRGTLFPELDLPWEVR